MDWNLLSDYENECILEPTTQRPKVIVCLEGKSDGMSI